MVVFNFFFWFQEIELRHKTPKKDSITFLDFNFSVLEKSKSPIKRFTSPLKILGQILSMKSFYSPPFEQRKVSFSYQDQVDDK